MGGGKIIPSDTVVVSFLPGAGSCSTREVTELLKRAGFVDLEYVQTLTRHPKYSNDAVEKPRWNPQDVALIPNVVMARFVYIPLFSCSVKPKDPISGTIEVAQ